MLPDPVPSTAHPNDARMDLSPPTIPTTATVPSIPPPPPPPPQAQVPLAQPWTKNDRPRHLPGSTSDAPPSGYTRSGRTTCRPDLYVAAIDVECATDIGPPSPPNCMELYI